MPCSRKVPQLADIHSFDMLSWKTTVWSSYAYQSMMGEVANTHGHVGPAVWAGQPQPWVLGVWLRCEAPLALGLGSTAVECIILVNTRSPNKHCLVLLQVWLQCPAVVSCPHCDSGTWVSARSSYSFAVLYLWLACSCLYVVFEIAYINHINKTFIRNGPLNRVI